jgi:hypothetical protein
MKSRMTTQSDGSRNTGCTGIWEGVDRLIDAAPSVLDLQAHGLHLLAARRWRALGVPVPQDVARAELWAELRVTAARTLLERIRATCEGPIVLIKGPAVSTAYPDPALRPFLDLDLLVADPTAAQTALLAAGFEPVPARMHPETMHHLHPLQLPGSPLSLELHERPKWIEGRPQPSFDELIAGCEPARFGVEGILTLQPAYHALVLVAHLWAHDPSARLLRFLDVAVLSEAAPSGELDRLADAWAMRRPWTATRSVADALFRGSREPLSMRLWARNLSKAREPKVFELHASRCLSPFFVLPPRLAARAAGKAAAGLFRPQPYEGWGGKLRRTAQQLRHPAMRRSVHGREVAANLILTEPTSPPKVQPGVDTTLPAARSQKLEP